MTAPVTKLSQLDPNGVYSYADYLTWQFQERIELIRGHILSISPAPSVRHQRIVGAFHLQMATYSKKKPCQLFLSPFDVRLYNRKKSVKASKDIFTVVQPDLCIICDDVKLDEQGCNGAPDLVVEVLSPGNTKREMNEKFDLYRDACVLEYWLVEPADEVVLVYVLEGDQYIGLKPMTDILTSRTFPDLVIDLTEVFE